MHGVSSSIAATTPWLNRYDRRSSDGHRIEHKAATRFQRKRAEEVGASGGTASAGSPTARPCSPHIQGSLPETTHQLTLFNRLEWIRERRLRRTSRVFRAWRSRGARGGEKILAASLYHRPLTQVLNLIGVFSLR